ncbi:MAG: GNAT family N-acetyltransferase [Actinomycetota bacterium]
MREAVRSGPAYLATATTLLQRVRLAHPTAGLYEAAELQWWWSVPRPTDDVGQLFWLDDAGDPVAAAVVNDFGNGTSQVYTEPIMALIVLPEAGAAWVEHVVGRALEHFAGQGITTLELELDRADVVGRDTLFGFGFEVIGDGVESGWLDAADRPAITPLADGYRLTARSEISSATHHLATERSPAIEDRLRQTSLYRPDLDLVVLDQSDEPAAFGLCWFDQTTRVGLVEPMRTHEQHRGRGLARHLLTSGAGLLFDAGASRISISYEPGNPASGPLYRSIGFEPYRRSDIIGRAPG